MFKHTSRKIIFVILFALVICFTPIYIGLSKQKAKVLAPQLLSDPWLQLPTKNSVRVVWFTEFPGSKHIVTLGQNFNRTVLARTTKLTRTREDQNSQLGKIESAAIYSDKPVKRDIWRHEALVTGLKPGVRVSYRVTSTQKDGLSVSSRNFTLAPTPTSNIPLKILLTSDHQLKPMVAANMQKVVETVGKVDGVFFAGDAVSIADRASEWFDDNGGGAFFPCLQGRANKELEYFGVKTTYRGGEIIQHAPIFTTIGNHELMGRFSQGNSLNDEYSNAIPREEAKKLYGKKYLKNNSFNTDTYEEIFSLPKSEPGGETYYAVTFGNVRLVSLYITNIWRTPNLEARGKYQESQADLNNPKNWGYGQFIFEPIAAGSSQYKWLQQELNSPEFKQAKYKIVMFHHPPHSLGDNIVPAFTNPVQVIERNANGKIKAVRYKYPKNLDYLTRDVIPLLEKANVQLVFYGHSHLWNRFRSQSGMHFLETSNVGNTYGAFWDDKKRSVPAGDIQNFTEQGDANGLEPLLPSISPLKNAQGKLAPYISSNNITVFSILNTGNGTISSYRFDTNTREPVIKFDEFNLK